MQRWGGGHKKLFSDSCFSSKSWRAFLKIKFFCSPNSNLWLKKRFWKLIFCRKHLIYCIMVVKACSSRLTWLRIELEIRYIAFIETYWLFRKSVSNSHSQFDPPFKSTVSSKIRKPHPIRVNMLYLCKCKNTSIF